MIILTAVPSPVDVKVVFVIVAIDDKGIAKEHSLRKMEVVIPCTLVGKIHDVPKEMAAEIERAVKYIKRMGQNRNRGLGRCTIESIEEKEEGGKQ